MTTLTSPRLNAKRAVPELYQAMLALDEAVTSSGLDPLVAELVKIRASQINGCAYCLNMHAQDALKAGERPERLHVLAGWRARRRPGSTTASGPRSTSPRRSRTSARAAYPTTSATPLPSSSPRPSSARCSSS
jgi:AhpD family alkylhydroperoxidase